MTRALIVFVLMYSLMLAFPNRRTAFALVGALLMVVLGVLPPERILGSINWNALLMIVGTMGIVSMVMESNMPSFLADLLLRKVSKARYAIVLLCVFSGLVSAVVDNVATVLMVAPIGIEMCKKLKTNPVGVIVCIALSSNLQGAATLVGDTTSILLGSYASMGFSSFFFMHSRPSIFWAVELGALGTAFVILWLFRGEQGSVSYVGLSQVHDIFPTLMLSLSVLLMVVLSFVTLPVVDSLKNGLASTLLCLVCIVRSCIRERGLGPLGSLLHSLDLQTPLMLAGLFIVVASLSEVGLIDALAQGFVKVGEKGPFVLYIAVVMLSVILSAFIDNIPYVATMLPVIRSLSLKLGMEPTFLYFGLLCGATLGGNLTPFGASANVAALGILRKAGYEVKTSTFMRISIPFTLVAVLVSATTIWLVWGPVAS